ncbi:hydrogenase maturation protease [Jhaorihella thermophila]|uniref:Hydrogenase maturation protease n=1 Tax=Jhaorihella thermophila TaxID=488547 RepID=A0A1H5UIA0_9RHOB|nr:hydrogenase maturation protease [Jhaorihella thermophila]SEF74754.1 hydrogenase maturation protease [Jhaorihella thermophila]
MTGPVRLAVIGIGNPRRGDDAVGREVARWLRGRAPQRARVLDTDGEPASLIALLDGLAAVWIVDACRSGARAGAIRRLDVSATALPSELTTVSTHGLGLAEAIELARAIDRLPPHCVVYAIEASAFDHGSSLTPDVAAAVAETGRRILAEISAVGARLEG